MVAVARQLISRGSVEERVVGAMSRAGFPLLKRDELYAKPIGRVLYPEDELIFNRGLDGKQSNFCVFAKCELDGTVALHHYNPDPKGIGLKRNEFIRKTILPPDANDSEIEDAVKQIQADAAHKKPNEFFFSPHSHFGTLAPPYYDENGRQMKHGQVDFDDGVSFLSDNLRKALFYGIDYYALSTHNSFSGRVFEFMAWAGRNMSLIPIPSVELTLTLKEPNGPHVLLWMRDVEVAREVRSKILDKGTRLKMPSYFVGMPMEKILEILFELQKNNLLALGIAHPINFNSPELPIPVVGMYTAADTGANAGGDWFNLEKAEEIAKRG